MRSPSRWARGTTCAMQTAIAGDDWRRPGRPVRRTRCLPRRVEQGHTSRMPTACPSLSPPMSTASPTGQSGSSPLRAPTPSSVIPASGPSTTVPACAHPRPRLPARGPRSARRSSSARPCTSPTTRGRRQPRRDHRPAYGPRGDGSTRTAPTGPGRTRQRCLSRSREEPVPPARRSSTSDRALWLSSLMLAMTPRKRTIPGPSAPLV
jgi:hypothetical protein